MKKVTAVALFLLGCQHSEPASRRAEEHHHQKPASILVGASASPPGAPIKFEAHFSPNGGCEEATVKHIDAAQHTIFVQAYSFTSEPITHALVRAQGRGVDVEVVLDKSDSTAKGSTMPELLAGHVPTFIDAKHAIAHNKVMVFDGSTVETGSFNFTKAAEHANAENCLFLSDVDLATTYTENWRNHRAHSSSVVE